MKVKTNCYYCGKGIKVLMPRKVYKEHPELLNGCSCNRCVPENSAARDGINESIYTEA